MNNSWTELKKAFKANPALGFAVIIGLVAILYLLYRSNANANSGTSGNTTSNPPIAEVYAFDVTPPSVGVSSPPVSVSSPPTPTSGGGTGVLQGGNPPRPPVNPPIGVINPKPVSNNLKVTAQGALSSIYGGVHNGGRDITTLYPGNTVTIIGGPVSWGYDTYYQVTYGSSKGWVRAATIGK